MRQRRSLQAYSLSPRLTTVGFDSSKFETFFSFLVILFKDLSFIADARFNLVRAAVQEQKTPARFTVCFFLALEQRKRLFCFRAKKNWDVIMDCCWISAYYIFLSMQFSKELLPLLRRRHQVLHHQSRKHPRALPGTYMQTSVYVLVEL